MPFIKQGLREGKPVGIAFRIKPSAWITIAISRAANATLAFEKNRIHPQVGKPLDEIGAAHACTDEDHAVVITKCLLLADLIHQAELVLVLGAEFEHRDSCEKRQMGHIAGACNRLHQAKDFLTQERASIQTM